ncbi:bifunctional [glutamate--ammonia ligase]-adenylyl-L-tyrosine phosphorylase/[glutamate--ammonia-ligase] adenylyltransferase [Candidimonas nitroreducens]|uniref:Bifunctional glutamine synthetase adenylyltransferase/adenylyl-removing enzyme n=1 Tax=Candidimonas nitroreducens TaxID=683354 RepID=A0A225N1L2_9BURK|nr:bifunctional [glutamate--ammonia ligase]-adenylyl-L-tyrosine phosphorylase/[glutamate--ammonia-ligase] adenylyltransferase [Candidimonas nitroreducens]OWT65741.1 bifunctional glutamine synthetase adenylyltransferase/deadenyltransferase [Candidimonas nitroreducens]
MPTLDILEPALRWSGALRRKTSAHADFTQWLVQAVPQPVDATLIHGWYAELAGSAAAADAATIRRALRQLRDRVFYTLLARDIGGMAPLAEVVGAMSALADLAVGQAYRCVATDLAQVHGVPLDPATGRPQEMLILGMGKLGGEELNVSSDIDLIMLYGEEGETGGRRKISHHEFYGRLTQRMMPILSDLDAHGQVFRTDLRLRPDGDSGPLAWSLDALESYLVTQGREWERYAWLKARPISCTAFEGSDSTRQIAQFEALRTPFVYRKYFDFDALAALRALRERIRQDWQRRALARNGVDTTHNIKLGDGGIREIEFVVQLTQLIRGGRMPSLQQRNLLEALARQKDAGIVSSDDARRLEEAYIFLRRTEHMLQYREDEQTHLLPADPQLRAGLAAAMGMQAQEFEAALQQHRGFVAQLFRNAFRTAGMGDDESACKSTSADGGDLGTHIRSELGASSSTLDQRLESLLDSHRIRSLPETSRRRLEALLPAAISAAARTSHPEQAALRLFDLIEQVAQRSAYLALLAEYPETLARLARLVAASPWASQYLGHYPLLLDSLIEWRSLLEPPDFGQIAQQMRTDLDACVLPNGRPDIEQQMNMMRDVQRQVSFQLLAQDLEGVLSVEKLADQLSALADMLLAETVHRVWPLVQRRGAAPQPLAPPKFAVIAYGKLGGKEIGYASDLDLVFVFDDSREDATEIYAKLGQRMSTWLSTMTSSGRLYEVDLRLRPDGEAGLLAVSLDAFSQYQFKHAWAWEHQALTRARYAVGDAEVGRRFEQIRREVLLLPRDPQELKHEVQAMRDKISAGHPNHSTEFDLKHDRGGMVDVEFVTQYLVLSQACRHPELLDNLGNITLLRLAAQAGLVDSELAAGAADAYRVFRKLQHELRLQGAEKARVPADSLGAARATVRRLWQAVIGD